jgi:hypothetical protein
MPQHADIKSFTGFTLRVARIRSPLLAAFLGLSTGCAEPPPPSISSNLALTAEEALERRVLDEGQQEEVLAAMRGVAAGHEVQRVPAPASERTGGMRWADVPAAVAGACDEIEAAVLRSEVEAGGDRYRFEILTVEDRRGELVVSRVPGPRLYEATATIGRFPADPADARRAHDLLEALGRQMKALGRKRAYPDE